MKPTPPPLKIIAGPCMAESFDLLESVIDILSPYINNPHVDFTFKASFDKANRTSISSSRGPGLDKTLSWFQALKKKYHIKITTDIHETYQANPVAEVCDTIQIPAFLCRQTSLIEAAIKTGAEVNIKKGQFLSPYSIPSLVEKCISLASYHQKPLKLSLTERGTCFGYGDLICDPRSFKLLKTKHNSVIFDVTHSTQTPPNGSSTTKALRSFAPLLTRSALITGYVDGIFLETHPEPSKALSDQDAQLNKTQARSLIDQALALWPTAWQATQIDNDYN
jgi:2-dehydro-3-deoxyphosphooctonate aldolase (KDO 8-P synthase)